MKKKLACILIMCLVLVGCGNKVEVTEVLTDAPDTEATTEITTEELTEEVTEATPEDADVATMDDADKASGSDAMSDASQGDAEGEFGTLSHKDNGKIIVLDPGHSSVVSGTTEPLGPGSSEMKASDSSGTRGVSSGLTEYELNFMIATQLRDELEARGYTVIMTREDNNTQISCAERAQIANEANADVFLRIHGDGSENSSASGAMGICITPSNPYISSMYSECRILSDAILNSYVAETGLSSRGVWETDTMTGNNWSQVPTTLIEMGFMTNPTEDLLMADSDFQKKIVIGIANGIDTYCFTD